MGNSILAGTVSLNPFLPPLALAQEKPSLPPAQLSSAPAPVDFGVVVGPSTTDSRRRIAAFLALATTKEAEHSKSNIIESQKPRVTADNVAMVQTLNETL